MHLIVTRPATQAEDWLAALQAEGHSTDHLPLIDISLASSPQDQKAHEQALQGMIKWQAIMFVSANAAAYFFKKNMPYTLIDTARSAILFIASPESKIRCWATGPGTLRALLAAGVPQEMIDSPAHDTGQFDSESLWQTVQSQVQAGGRVLMVRGRDVDTLDSSRDWLAQQIEAQGAMATSLVVYERRAPQLTAQQIAQSQAWLRDGSAWLFSSSQALRHLPAQLDTAQGICICTHERVALAAKIRGFAVVCTSRPTVRDVVASIKSLND